MHAAPAVTVSAGCSAATRAALAVLAGLTVACCALWAAQRADLPSVCAFVAVTGWVVLSLASWAREPVRRLRWDGQNWALASAHTPEAGLPGELAVAIDLGPWLLLRFRGLRQAGPPLTVWLAVQRSDHPIEWHALRCAVYSRARPG